MKMMTMMVQDEYNSVGAKYKGKKMCGRNNFDQNDVLLKSGKGASCPNCYKILSDRRNVNRHLRRVHGIQPQVRGPKLNCSFDKSCHYVCATKSKLREHLKEAHDFIVELKELNFSNRKEFETWKEEEERTICVSYVTDTGSKMRNNKKTCYLRCHRSGNFRAENSGLGGKRKRSKPSRGYTQCGITCPSSMQVTEDSSGEIHVLYYFTHLGHKLDVGSVKYMKLSAQEKNEIAAKIAEGEPIDKILTEARQKKGSKLSRINLLQRRDVYNIKSKVNYLEKEMEHDGNVLDFWVKKMKIESSYDPIVHYKPMDESNDYLLVLIHPIQPVLFSLVYDGSIVYVKTKKGKPNLDYNLTTIVVANESGDAFPIAFCVSSKTDFTTFLAFYKHVYDVYGVIATEIFICDNVAHYYLAWRNIMTESKDKLICTFNIESQWGQKLSDLQCPVEKHESVMKRLIQLLRESEKDTFEGNLVDSLNAWNEDEDLKVFVKYFYKFYGKPCEWADCYRIQGVANRNINDCFTATYNALETIYQEGIRDLNHGLNLLFGLIRDSCFIYLARCDSGFLTEKLEEVEKTHQSSDKVHHVRQNGNDWIITNGENEFLVRKELKSCKSLCGLLCTSCNICIHDYSCHCRSYIVDFIICEHIHAVASKRFEEDPSYLKSSAISLVMSLQSHLKDSEKTAREYGDIIMTVNQVIRDHFVKQENEFHDALADSTTFKMSLKIVANTEDSNNHGCNVSNVLYHSDRVISGADDGKIKVWMSNLDFVSELQTGAGILSIVAIDNQLYTCGTDETIQCWDLNTLKNVGRVSSTLFQPQKLYVEKETKILWAGDAQGNIAKYQGLEESGKYELCEEVWDIIVKSHPPFVYTARDRDIVVAEIIVGNKARVMVKSTLEGRSPICFAGNHICFLNREGRNICIHEDDAGKKFPRINEIVASDLIVNALASASDDIVFSGGYDSVVNKWNIRTLKNEGSVNLGSCINAISCHSGKEIYVARSDGKISSIEV